MFLKDGKTMNPQRGNTFLIQSSQQLPLLLNENNGIDLSYWPDLVIDSVDFNHDRLTSFRTVKIEPKESSTEGGSGASKKKTPPTVIELNLVTAAVVNFFKVLSRA